MTGMKVFHFAVLGKCPQLTRFMNPIFVIILSKWRVVYEGVKSKKFIQIYDSPLKTPQAYQMRAHVCIKVQSSNSIYPLKCLYHWPLYLKKNVKNPGHNDFQYGLLSTKTDLTPLVTIKIFYEQYNGYIVVWIYQNLST